ncbi:hypothetical protein [uncultured Tessaracoccus sp.]|uniref:hypothetical protein n=1 Tax=uncultured Tessaracoccus sp. TaxID=905023 RepID=UPI00262DAA0E|nr:hypothetical protein [uncultured Tessaracoccus sp.]
MRRILLGIAASAVVASSGMFGSMAAHAAPAQVSQATTTTASFGYHRISAAYKYGVKYEFANKSSRVYAYSHGWFYLFARNADGTYRLICITWCKPCYVPKARPIQDNIEPFSSGVRS